MVYLMRAMSTLGMGRMAINNHQFVTTGRILVVMDMKINLRLVSVVSLELMPPLVYPRVVKSPMHDGGKPSKLCMISAA